MAIAAFDSKGGFSISDSSGNITIVIDELGNVTTPVLTVLNLANLGNVANVKIQGGLADQYLKTDGNGNLSFSTVGGDTAGMMPFFIPVGETYIIPENKQGLFALPIEIQGTLEVNGILVEV